MLTDIFYENTCIFQSRKMWVSKVALLHIFANLVNVYLNRRELGS